MVRDNASRPRDRLTVNCIVEQPAGPSNRYRADGATGAVILDGVEVDRPRAPVEWGHLAGTLAADGRPLAAIVAVQVPTFAGCVVPVHPVGLAQPPGGGPPTVIAVPVADQVLAAALDVADLPDAVRAAIAARMPGGSLATAEAAEAEIRRAREAERRARADAQRAARAIPAWKVSDERAPIVDGREAQPHTFAEQAVTRLPARFQEYIARELLPDERILMFIHRPVTVKSAGFGLRRTRLREAIWVLTDRQVMFMTDSLDPGSLLVHWGYIARVSAVERVTAVQVREHGPLVALDVTFGAIRGAETATFEFPDSFAPAVAEAADLLRGFAPTPGSRSLRRVYARDVPRHLPSLAEARAPDAAPTWARQALPDERLLAWAQAPGRRERPPTLVVGERSIIIDGHRRGSGACERLSVDEVTSLEMTLSLTGSGLEVAVGDGESVTRRVLRFDYPAAPPFLGAFSAIRHLMGLPPGVREHV